ncbi:acyltransferase [Truncatella angustata]|uniref:Acyltransferase n=1 Tax=Truncatella angustata TaxID=152316 RepID=A0A9P8UHW5_9PEZI|nr:acyltransferase [Truncatella angustata]KAH6652384.1 acyltransferase [Truncatella angustata]
MVPFWPKSTPSPGKLGRTAYLDGLRGFAAFIVYWHHHELWAHRTTNQNHLLENSFGYEGNHHLVAFPFIRVFFNGGHYAVATFFVISGYALSSKPMRLIQESNHLDLGASIASALFRRWFRLWVPLMIVTFIYVSSWHLLGTWVEDTTRQDTWLQEVWVWYAEMKRFNFVFGDDRQWLSYDMHLWSIPVEMKGSIIIYTALMSLSRTTKNARLWCEAALIFYFIYIADGWFGAMFMSGMLLCDLDLLAEKQQLPQFLGGLAPFKLFIFYHLLAISMYLGGVPECDSTDISNLKKQRGWYYLSLLKPQAVFDYKWFYLLWAASMLVASAPRIKWLKSFLETRFCQYLGRISYGLYLVHGPIIWTLGDRVYAAVGWHGGLQVENLSKWVDRIPLPKTGLLGLEVAFMLPHIVLLPVTIWAAEIVTRLIDVPSVKFSQWLYAKATPSVSDRTGPVA